jgi:hypothetical protein
LEEQRDFFSPKHKQLLSAATWAKILAWVILAGSILTTTSYIVTRSLTEFGQGQTFNNLSQNTSHFLSFWLGIISNTVYGLLKGIVSFVGLNMIVETDLNYREKTTMPMEENNGR